ncbi:MAG TPA: hypothetical protein VFG69_00470, partial [Nannocystaceae bacterium]|nr:hypothetical protein [Nannocystaceae bacterium]
MKRWGRWARAFAASSLAFGCGPAASDDDDAYPRNCGVDGPVDLFESLAPAWLWATRAGDVYLVEHSPDEATLEYWAVDRCGEQRVLLDTTAAVQGSPLLGVAGDWVLSCDDATGAMSVVDPRGLVADRRLFESVEACRVVIVGNGLAVQERGGATVWFHPDPADPHERALVVTDSARVADPEWILGCWHDFACESDHPFGVDIRAAGDELLILLQTDELLAFSASSLSSRIVDSGPVHAIDVLDDGNRLVVDRDLEPTLVIERTTGASFEFCCFDDLDPIRLLGDWLVKGWWEAPIIPEPPEWTTFRARHLLTGQTSEVVGHDAWDPRARLTADAILVHIAGDEGSQQYAVWPATGERRRVDLPDSDVVWTLRGEDGVFVHADDRVMHVAAPDATARTLIDDAAIVFPTRRGRIVFEAPRESAPEA